MNKYNKAVIIVLSLLVAASNAFAATDQQAVNMEATIGSAFEMDVLLFNNDIDGTEVTGTNTMNFGTLTDIGTGTLRSSTPGAVLAYINVNSNSGQQWTLTQTGTPMTRVGGSETLEQGSLNVVPVYVSGDNGGATGGAVGAKGTWVSASPKTLYTSPATGGNRVIRAYYSITDDSAAGATAPNIPLDKVAGTYRGTVTFTATV